nr:DUF21 domain-containing protein At2g14520-like [Tanacetum cinerariifolium]
MREFHSCKQKQGQSVSSYVLKIKSYIDNLEHLGHPVSLGLGVSLILISLSKEFDSFMQNYNMHSMGKTINELHAMLNLYEQTLPKKRTCTSCNLSRQGLKRENKHKKPQPQLAHRGQNQRNGKNKFAYASKPKIPPPHKREDPTKDLIPHQCGETCHWKRKCPHYLADLLKNKKLSQGASSLGALSLYVDNGQRAAIEAIGSYHLSLPSGLVIVLNNCHYAPSITRENSLITQEASGSLEDLEIIQKEDTSTRTRHAPDRMCLYINAEEHEFEDLGFVNPKYPNRVCKLKRSIYGLKQASRQWNKRFDDEIKKFGFTQNRDEPCVYLKASGSNVTFLILYVDDILIMGNNIPMLQDVKSYLGRCFAMKDLGEVAYILGIKIYRNRSGRLIGLCQSAYIKKILKRYHMENSKRRSIPMQDKLRLSKSQGASTPAELKRMQNVPYASVVGSIMYAVRCTRLDVANTKDMFLVYGGDIKRELRVSCYTDAGYLTDADDLKYQTRYVFVLNGGVVDWKSAKQSIFEHINMYCDNTRAITIANESGITKARLVKLYEDRIIWMDIEGVPLKAWSRETFIKIGKKWGETLDLEDNYVMSFGHKRICIKTKHVTSILESFKIIVKGKFYMEFDDEYASDVNKVPDTAFGENASSNLRSNDSVKVHQSEDPFSLYDLLNKKKAGETGKSSPSISHPPGFTPEILEDQNDNEAKIPWSLLMQRFCYMGHVEYECCETQFFVHILIIIGLVLFAGLMSGLTLGLMSLSLVDLEVLLKSGTPKDRKYAAKILPVVKKQHLLLCTLLICNAAAMEALPIFLDGLVTAWGAILISVTLILLFGEIIPQSVCTRYGLAIGAYVAPFVRVLVWVCFPVAYPISKLLDYLLGHEHVALFRRAELKTLVNMHGNEAGKGGELTHDETTIIAGALELTEKTASDAMTPISDTFSVDINAILDRNLMNLILEKGHSRVPIYYEQPTNIIGLVLVKNLLTIHPEDEVPVKSVTIRKIPKVPENLPLYDILNEFQKGHSHMAVVVRQCNKTTKSPVSDGMKEVRVDVDVDGKGSRENSLKSKRSLQKWKSIPNGNNSNREGSFRSRKRDTDMYSDILEINGQPLPKVPEEEEAVGIITMEDVIEELLQEEIFDETDHQFEDS